MPIYSTNRVSTASGRNTIVAAEGYTENDFGRILQECAINDMRLFNAAIARDFQEATAIQENTMVASELTAIREFSVKEAWNGLVSKLKKLWAKIKAAFATAYAKISVLLNKYNKTYIAQNRKLLVNKKGLSSCPIPKYRKRSENYKSKVDDFLSFLNAYSDITKKSDSRSVVGTSANADDVDTKKMIDACFDAASEGRTFGDLGMSIDVVFSNLSGASDYLKEVKRNSSKIDKVMSKMIKQAEAAAKKAEDGSADKESYQNASKNITTVQSYVTKYSKALIGMLKFAISNDRGLIAALVAYSPKTEAVDLAMAYSIGFRSFVEEAEEMTPEDAADEAQELEINISIDGDVDADVNVEDNTDGGDEE